MAKISKSASRIVLILIALTICVSFIIGVVKGKTVVETKDFLPLAVMVFTYYFTKYGKASNATEEQEKFSDSKGL